MARTSRIYRVHHGTAEHQLSRAGIRSAACCMQATSVQSTFCKDGMRPQPTLATYLEPVHRHASCCGFFNDKLPSLLYLKLYRWLHPKICLGGVSKCRQNSSSIQCDYWLLITVTPGVVTQSVINFRHEGCHMYKPAAADLETASAAGGGGGVVRGWKGVQEDQRPSTAATVG